MPDKEARRIEAEKKKATGRAGEDLAARYLERQGCAILKRNWRANPGEVDIVARCPVEGESVLLFVEVRTRHGRAGLAEESLSRRKALSMTAAAYAYMSAHDLDPEKVDWRIDLLAISPSGELSAVNWVKGAISEDVLG